MGRRPPRLLEPAAPWTAVGALPSGGELWFGRLSGWWALAGAGETWR